MASIINADTSNGLKLTSDTTGIIQLQNAGTTKLTVNSSGATVAGTLAATAVTGDGSGLTGLSAGGKILQVLQATKTDTFSTNSQTFVDIPDMTVTITPSSTSSKVLVSYQLQSGASAHSAIKAVRTLGGTTTDVLVGDADGNRTRANQKIYTNNWGPNSAVVQILDSPNTTSAVTYKVQCGNPYSASYYTYINRSASSSSGSNFSYDVRSSSTITVMEVAA